MAGFLSTVRKGMQTLNPQGVRDEVNKPVHVGVMAIDEAGLNLMWQFFAPAWLGGEKQRELVRLVHALGPALPGIPPPPAHVDLELWQEQPVAGPFRGGSGKPAHAFTFYANDPERTVREILAKREDLAYPLARQFPIFRKQVSERIIRGVCSENTMFSAATAIPNIIPLLSLPFAVGEFASDTAFLTMNQMRMAFLLAGIHDREVGYLQQKGQVAGVIAGAFGWRAIARQLVSKIPFGGGVIGKAAVSYGGTWLVGRALERLYRGEQGMSKAEQEQEYESGLQAGKRLAQKLLAKAKGN